MTDTLDELEKLLKLLVEAMPNWRVGHTGPFMTEAKGHSFHIFDDGDTLVLPTPGQPGPIAIVAGPAKAALIAAAISALPGLLESARRVERLEAALQKIADPQPTFAGPPCCGDTFADACELFGDIAATALKGT